jgi:hypothetical protein
MKMRTFFLNIFILWSHFLFTQEMEWDQFKNYIYTQKGKVYFNNTRWTQEEKGDSNDCGVNLRIKIITNENLKISDITSFLGDLKATQLDTLEVKYYQNLTYKIYSEYGCETPSSLATNTLSFSYLKNKIFYGNCRVDFACTRSTSEDLQDCKKLIPDIKKHLNYRRGKIYYKRKVPNQSNMVTFMKEFTNKYTTKNYGCCSFSESFIGTSPEKIIQLYGIPTQGEKNKIDSSLENKHRSNLFYKYIIYVRRDANYKEEIPFNRHIFREDSKYFIFPIYFWFLEEKLVMVDYSMPIPYKVKPKRGIRGVFRRLGL